LNTPQNEPIEVYTWTTPNGYKIHIACEEMGLSWKPIAVDIGKGDQFKPDFLKFSPNNKIPAIIDPNGPDGKPLTLFESGAILIYLAEKTGKFFGNSHRERLSIIQWLMFQMGGVGPMLGQAHHFRIYAPEPIEYAINRYTNEAKRLYEVINKQLNPWVYRWQRQGIELSDYPAVHKWYEALSARPAVIKALNTNLE
jgi:GST-like protein